MAVVVDFGFKHFVYNGEQTAPNHAGYPMIPGKAPSGGSYHIHRLTNIESNTQPVTPELAHYIHWCSC